MSNQLSQQLLVGIRRLLLGLLLGIRRLFLGLLLGIRRLFLGSLLGIRRLLLLLLLFFTAAAAGAGWKDDPFPPFFPSFVHQLKDLAVIISSYFRMLVILMHLLAVSCAAGGCPDESLVSVSERQSRDVMSVVLWNKPVV